MPEESIEKRLEQLIKTMEEKQFKGTYKITNKNTIEWKIQEKIEIEINLYAHGGDDQIITRFEDPIGKKHEIYDDLSTNNNKELIDALNDYNKCKIEIIEKKRIFGKKYTLSFNK